MEQTAEYTTNYVCSLVMQKPIQYKQLGLIKKTQSMFVKIAKNCKICIGFDYSFVHAKAKWKAKTITMSHA